MQDKPKDYTKPILYSVLIVVFIIAGIIYVIGTEIQECTNRYNKTTAIYQAWILNDTTMTDSYGNAGSAVPTKNIQELLSIYNDECGEQKKMIFVIENSPNSNYGDFMDIEK